MQKISCIVLAGGKSHRLGRDKAFLEIGGTPLIERVTERLKQVGDEVLLVTNNLEPFAYLQLPVIKDVHPGQGVLGGLYTGLRAARHQYSLVVACDMPFLDPKLLRYMVILAPGHDVVIPCVRGMYEPLHAIYSQDCVGPIERVLAQGKRRIVDFFPAVRVRYVSEEEVSILDPQLLSFFNINTPEDLSRARQLAASGL